MEKDRLRAVMLSNFAARNFTNIIILFRIMSKLLYSIDCFSTKIFDLIMRSNSHAIYKIIRSTSNYLIYFGQIAFSASAFAVILILGIVP